ncbi:MAG: PIG-L family deacetylase [Chloroflexi bacterium]|nr:PIG-L family deacetylase [Chloroflexota bacterium]
MNKTVLVICPHADDAAAFCGGQVIHFANEGWRVVMVRVTNDQTDSIGLSPAETIRVNTEQMYQAARILGVSEIAELGYVTDCLGDVSRVELRERFIRLFRQHRPYAVLSFDPYAQYEPNLDHVVVSQAVEEAYWTATFDKHHPEHLAQGWQPHSVCERWYFARQLPAITCAVDISGVIEQRIDALAAHVEMMRNTLNQLKLQLATWGRRVPLLDAAVESGDLRDMLSVWVKSRARHWGQQYGLDYAEVYRVERFGGLEAFCQRESVPLPGLESLPMHNRPWFEV